ncbi:MAG: DUF559 domain-containing protein [Deltaproteobacteria bacterium]|nr:DUF559 domain-containing protein [Deltaproteobacteria bacterium]
MRFGATPSEAALWRELRRGRLGVVFRGQVPLLGRYIADFYAPAAGLVVEVDGAWHGPRERADSRRDEALRRARGRRAASRGAASPAHRIATPSRVKREGGVAPSEPRGRRCACVMRSGGGIGGGRTSGRGTEARWASGTCSGERSGA